MSEPGAPIRVLIADDQELVRAGFSMIIDSRADLEVVGEAGDGVQAVAQAGRVRPDVVLMDVRMPRMDGIEATRQLAADTKVLILTTFDDDEYVYAALRAGASGFLVKDMALDDILAAVRVVAAGDALIAPSVTRRLIETFARTPRPAPVPARGCEVITERESEVLTLVGRGLTNTEIAARLHISVATAKVHVSRLLTKLDARDRVQLVILAYELGLTSARRADG